MKVLFVSSGNSIFGISPIIKAQGEALRKSGVEIDYFAITGRGIRGYLRNIPKLRRELKEKKYDIVHAHYGYCGWVAVLSTPGIPVVISLMGSDVFGKFTREITRWFFNWLNLFLANILVFFTASVIVKSKKLRSYLLRKKNSVVIPNGVDLTFFFPMNPGEARGILKWDSDSKKILFLGNPMDLRKNMKLAEKAIEKIEGVKIEIVNPYPIEQREVNLYLNAADVLLFTSIFEGSPNVIKEAMACNSPIVSTDVGDVKWVLGDTNGCFISSFVADDIAEKIKKALSFGKRTNGRERIKELGLDSDSIAGKIVAIYRDVSLKSGPRFTDDEPRG